MEPWLLALDLDGTTCNDEGCLGEKTKQALAAARRAGHTVVFATGRRDVDMLPLGEDYRCADYLTLNNGGKLVRTADGAVLANTLVDPAAARTLVERCLKEEDVYKRQVEQIVAESGVQNGMVTVLTKHTTTGVTVNESLECLESDIAVFLGRLAPEDFPYSHARMLKDYGSTAGNPTGHLKAYVTGNHCHFPIIDGEVDVYKRQSLRRCPRRITTR